MLLNKKKKNLFTLNYLVLLFCFTINTHFNDLTQYIYIHKHAKNKAYKAIIIKTN